MDKLMNVVREQMTSLEKKVADLIEEKDAKLRKEIEKIPLRMNDIDIYEELNNFATWVLMDKENVVRMIQKVTFSDLSMLINEEHKSLFFETVKQFMDNLEPIDSSFYTFFNLDLSPGKDKLKDIVSGDFGRIYITREEEREVLGWFKEIFVEGLRFGLGMIEKDEFMKKIFPFFDKIMNCNYLSFDSGILPIRYIRGYHRIGDNEIKKRIKNWYQAKNREEVQDYIGMIDGYNELIYVLNEEQLDDLKKNQIPYFEKEFEEIMEKTDPLTKYEQLKRCYENMVEVKEWKIEKL